MKQDPLRQVEPFRADVDEARSNFLRALAELPDSMRKIVIKHVENRIARAAPRPLLGEFVPWLLADILGISDNRAVQQIASHPVDAPGAENP